MAIDAFLKIEGIPGESRDAGHDDELDVLSYSFSANNSGSSLGGTGGGAGRVAFTDLNVVTFQSKATPLLLQRVADGKSVPSALLSVRRAGGTKVPEDFWTVKLTDVLVTGVHEATSSGEDRPTEAFSLSFAKIEWSYREQRTDGTLAQPVSGGWDLRSNKAT